MIKKCNKCGSYNLDDAKFCENCGNQLAQGMNELCVKDDCIQSSAINLGIKDTIQKNVTSRVNDISSTIDSIAQGKKKKRKWIISGIIGVVIIILMCSLGIKNGQKDNSFGGESVEVSYETEEGMSEFVSNLAGFLWIGLSVLCWIIYHKIFTVYYFNLRAGLGKEIIGCLIAGMCLTGLICYVWWLAAILLGIAAIISFKAGKKALAVICIVIIIVVAIIGIGS